MKSIVTNKGKLEDCFSIFEMLIQSEQVEAYYETSVIPSLSKTQLTSNGNKAAYDTWIL